MKMKPIMPGIPPYLDPELIKMGLKLLKKVVDFAHEVLVGEVGNKKPVDIEKSVAGEICDVKNKQEIQKINKNQWFIFLGFIIFVVILALVFNDAFKIMPTDLFKKF